MDVIKMVFIVAALHKSLNPQITNGRLTFRTSINEFSCSIAILSSNNINTIVVCSTAALQCPPQLHAACRDPWN